ncbi:MAG: putative toxin-antitoxin system toxin component, PIN family [Ignavibacteria bacterium GWB2_35_12]|nr:MAG: putative toxin-antitoxin system toxin component, PIN family [Ignavibacteria bacterium GWB2_35_12]OGU92859.1 MAG: putative toxin-antitoxin system toxin component, PIN family [Ignavibacteria bacterium RIFOXYA2_FULL_35_10]OGV19558.1 MAG: putative toxin-antitoxin system toxin component, PIN family [Ignavibacteria bacterium RIFOXYC2_FULL_35_21]
MTPVVIDTNVIVSSFYGGNPKIIIDLLKAEKIRLCISKDIINEYIKVLIRFKNIDHSEINELLNLFSNSRIVIFTGSTPKLKVVINDPDDDKFIECAVELGAEYIISGDKDLLSIKQFGNIKIVNPKQFLDIFETKL